MRSRSSRCTSGRQRQRSRAKNAEYRSAKISRETFEFLLHYLAEYRRLLQRQSLLFINIRGETAGKPMRVESVYDMLDRMEEKTGIKLTPHMLRRYYAVSRRDAGWALELIQLALDISIWIRRSNIWASWITS